MTTPNLDLVSIAAALAGAMLGPQMAPYVGAYTVILFAWVGGVLVGVYRRDPNSRMKTAVFVAVTFVLTIGSTAAAASMLAAKVSAESTTLLFPIAFMIPAVGDDWIAVGKWLFSHLRARFTKGP